MAAPTTRTGLLMGAARTHSHRLAPTVRQTARTAVPEGAASLPGARLSTIVRRIAFDPSQLTRSDAMQLQRGIGNAAFGRYLRRAPPPASRMGLPERLKAGIESLSGLALDDLRVHYNSAVPARVNALATTQGADIHLGPGQEQHLPHEAWHVVQQKQGRVKPTRQLNGAAINDDAELEREAVRMGAQALRMSPGHQDVGAPRVRQDAAGETFATSSAVPIQRMVGFEIEMPNIWVKRGTLKKTGKEERSDSDDEEFFIGGHGQSLSVTSSLLGRKQKSYSDQVEDTVPIAKKAPMHSGTRWNLTPDGSDADGWYAEFITDPIDETKQPAQIEQVLNAVTDYARGIGAMEKHEYRELQDRYLIQRNPGTIRGGFQVTGGIKLDQIVALLEQLSEEAKKYAGNQEDDESKEEYVELELEKEKYVEPKKEGYVELEKEERAYIEDESNILAGIANTVQQHGRSANYKGLVALAASYVASQKFGSENQGQPASAKHLLPVMSRTNLGAIRNKVTDMPSLINFINDVLAAAGLGNSAASDRLFPEGIGGGVNAARSIDTRPDITISEWLAGIRGGEDLKWSETSKSSGGAFEFEAVGPDIPQTLCCCIPWFATRAQGAIVELRNLKGAVKLDGWTTVGKTFAAVFRNLNAR
jgi:Domain of unknown function (DUF4157)